MPHTKSIDKSSSERMIPCVNAAFYASHIYAATRIAAASVSACCATEKGREHLFARACDGMH